MTSQLPPEPPRKKRRRNLWIIVAVVAVTVIFIGFTIKAIIDSGITRGPDAMFGDQHLKTSVALIELHKTRTGEYPESLSDLQFTGQWDQIALQSVLYVCAEDRETYFLEVQRGWVGKPKLLMPEGFWKGTGFDPDLDPKQNK